MKKNRHDLFSNNNEIVLPFILHERWMSYLLMDVQYANQSVSSDVVVTFMLIVMMTASSVMSTNSDNSDNNNEKEPAWMKQVRNDMILMKNDIVILFPFLFLFHSIITTTWMNMLMGRFVEVAMRFFIHFFFFHWRMWR